MSFDFDERDRRSVIGDLQSDDAELRRLAVERVSVLPLDEAVARLVDQLGDPSWRVRKAAIERLVASADADRVLDALIAALGDDENAGRRNGAMEVLVRSGPRAVPRLLEASVSEDTDLRKFAVDALAGIGDLRAESALLARLGDIDPNVRGAAADALAAVGGAQAPRALAALATRDGESQLVRFSALRALDALEVGLPLGQALPLLEDPVLRPAALAALSFEDGGEAQDLLLKMLASSSRATREATMRALLKLLSSVDEPNAREVAARIRECGLARPEALEDAFRRLEEADPPTRLMLVQFLGLLAREEVVIPLLKAAAGEPLREVTLATLVAMGEQTERVLDAEWSRLGSELRRDACVLLGQLEAAAGAERLRACLEDASAQVRVAAARAVAKRGLGDAVEALVRGLERVLEGERAEGDEQLGAFGDALVAVAGPGAPPEVTDRAVELLASRLRGPGQVAQLTLATLLGRIGRPRDRERVAALLDDPSPRVRRAALEALTRIEGTPCVEALRPVLEDSSPLVRMAAAAALADSDGPEARAHLVRLAGDPEALVRGAALRAVGRSLGRLDSLHRGRAEDLLHGAFADEAFVSVAALEALREAGAGDGERVLRLLESPEPEVILEALRWLEALGSPADVDAAQRLIEHSEWPVRAAAIQMLAERGRVGAVPAILRRLENERHGHVREVMLAAVRKLEG